MKPAMTLAAIWLVGCAGGEMPSLSGDLFTCRGDRCDQAFFKEPLGEGKDFVFVASADAGLLSSIDPDSRLEVRAIAGLKDAAEGTMLLAFLDGEQRSGPEGAAVLKRFACAEAELRLSVEHVFAGCPSSGACVREVPVHFRVRGDGLIVGRWDAHLVSDGGASLSLAVR